MAVLGERLQSTRAFLQTAEAGSFSEAARQIGQSKSTVAKAVARLEERLKVRLFHRTTRVLALTDEGRIFQESCLRALHALEEAEGRLAAHAHAPIGRLRISMPVLFGRDRVMPILLDLMARHEGLEVEAHFSNRPVHLIENRMDLAVRIGALPDTLGLTARLCGMQRTVTCAAPAYVAERGRPENPADLLHHECLGILRDDRIEPWRFDIEGRTVLVPVRGRFRLGHVEAVLQAALSGAGLAQLPSWLASGVIASGNLVPVLAAFEAEGLPVNLLWPTAAIVTPRIRVTIDALAAGLSAT